MPSSSSAVVPSQGHDRQPQGRRAAASPRTEAASSIRVTWILAAHYGFEPVACNVRKANEKGRVENGVGYVKKNFLDGLDIPSFAAVNPAARQLAATRWPTSASTAKPTANPSTCSPRKSPGSSRLPVLPYDCAVVRPISANGCCRVVLDTNRYTVPHLYASQKLTLKLYPDQLLLFHHEKLIATHAAQL